MNITYNNKKYCISPCAKDKFQRFIINPLSWIVTGLTIILGLGIMLEIAGFIFVGILFYALDVGVQLGTLFDCVIFGMLSLVVVGFGFMIYSILETIYISVSTRTMTNNMYALLFVIVFAPLFSIVTIIIGFGEFVFFLLQTDTFVWVGNRGFEFSGLIENSFVLGILTYCFIALFIVIIGIITFIPDFFKFLVSLVSELNNKVHDVMDKRYETKYKKECKLFVECTE